MGIAMRFPYCPDPHLGHGPGDLSPVDMGIVLTRFWGKIIPKGGHGILIPIPMGMKIKAVLLCFDFTQMKVSEY